MNGNVEMLVNYQQLLNMSKSMLSLAIEGKWNDLIDCEVDYLQTVEKVTHNELPASLPQGLQSQIRLAVKEILANESQLKTLLTGRMDELRALVTSSSHQRNISTTYGRISGNVLFPE
ncbi:flagella biosynthesis regulatory protein FliT [Erwinia oleae]|uniref:flagella biosynthesis regulatory protein FliT n=1 Tax=Erwinia oleae TaxID=796334 RepID=UPI000551A2F1|nr:flagella biosynthesis regulatory protein FliT [Erwinia oleae]